MKGRLLKNLMLKERYVDVVSSYILKGHAEQISEKQAATSGWYLPHHPVQHPHKPDKVRVVFDCGVKYAGSSLNAQLLKGSDFVSSLVGVLTRFCLEKFAVIGDVEQMFHQVCIDPKDRKYLRFLWWAVGGLNKEPTFHQVNVHLFGATSSPSCAQFGLLQSANDQAEEFAEPVRNLVLKNFCMDDCLFSVPSVDEGIRLIREVSSLLRNREFNLTKWCSNSQSILKSVPEEKRAKSVVELKDDQGSYERVLGMQWNLSEDLFQF